MIYANSKKTICYWIGFLEGVIACKEITKLESEALREQATDFILKTGDDDAKELIEEINQHWPDSADGLPKFINKTIKDKRKMLKIKSKHINENIFHGFLKGIACDNVVNRNEVEALLKLCDDGVWENENQIESDPRLMKIYECAVAANQDGIIDQKESDELCEYIAAVVGDTYADTGISKQRDIPQLEGMIHRPEDVSFDGAEFCLTGKFKRPKKDIEDAIEKLGGIPQDNVTEKTKYLILATEGSKYYATPNAGRKIKKAVNIREKKGTLEFIMESTVMRIIDTD